MVSEYSRPVLPTTKQATEQYSNNLLNRPRKPSEPYSDGEIQLPCELGSQVKIHRKLALSQLLAAHETVLGHLLISGWQCFLWAHCTSTGNMLGALCYHGEHVGCISSTVYVTMFPSIGGHASARRVSHCRASARCIPSP